MSWFSKKYLQLETQDTFTALPALFPLTVHFTILFALSFKFVNVNSSNNYKV